MCFPADSRRSGAGRYGNPAGQKFTVRRSSDLIRGTAVLTGNQDLPAKTVFRKVGMGIAFGNLCYGGPYDHSPALPELPASNRLGPDKPSLGRVSIRLDPARPRGARVNL